MDSIIEAAGSSPRAFIAFKMAIVAEAVKPEAGFFDLLAPSRNPWGSEKTDT